MLPLGFATAEQVLSQLGILEISPNEDGREAKKAARQWMYRNWIKTAHPAPHFRCGEQIFFDIAALNGWVANHCAVSNSVPHAGKLPA